VLPASTGIGRRDNETMILENLDLDMVLTPFNKWVDKKEA
jgi:hypothetical protein